MKASELRIGNLLRVAGANYKVTALGSRDDLIGLEGLNLTATKIIKPIPLTEEWLVKFGFTEFYHKGLKGYISDKMEFLYNLDSHQIYSYSEVNGLIWNLARCKHVHQLQNLYHALTGEELTIKNK